MDISHLSGLSSSQVIELQRRDGYNELPTEKPRSFIAIALSVLREPMFLLLLAGGVLYYILGDLQEALILVSFVFVIMGITLYQEHKTQRALERLRDLSSPRALVIRDGGELRIPGREVVCGDIIVVYEGDRVPADAQVITASNLSVDESLLTGESVTVQKFSGDEIYSSTLVVQGQAVAKVQKIGATTKIGNIGKALITIKPEKTRLQKQTSRLVRNVAIIGLIVCLFVALFYAISRNDLMHGLLAGIALAMSVLPEEIPVILTVFLALGAWRMAKRSVLTRQITSIESLGATTVLCVDKTGTITLNKMEVQQLYAGNEFFTLTKQHEIPEQFHEIIEYSILASQRDPFDPMEKAIKYLGEEYLANSEHLHYDWQLIQEYPLSKELLALSHVWQSKDKGSYEIAAKGAPEAIADLCHLSQKQINELEKKIAVMAGDGLRVLGVAKAKFSSASLPQKQHDFNFEFVGLIGLADPVRDTVQVAIKQCRDAGIRVIMITGDYPVTATKIAQEIGLSDDEKVITGQELNGILDLELKERIKATTIFARIVPEQKMRIVQALQASGEVVAMTGDGVNDAPALKAANIGIAMGERGTDVARESASLVLLRDDFNSIVHAVRMGRRIFDNIKKAISYTFAVHMPIIGMTLIPVVLKLPLVLLPVHIVFLELIIDPSCSIVFEAEKEEGDIMSRPPRTKYESVFDRGVILLGVTQGVLILIFILVLFFTAKHMGYSVRQVRALVFAALVLTNVMLILTNRSQKRSVVSMFRVQNQALWWVIGGAVVLLSAILTVPFLQSLFHFANINLIGIVIVLIATTVSIVCLEAMKFLQMTRRTKNHPA